MTIEGCKDARVGKKEGDFVGKLDGFPVESVGKNVGTPVFPEGAKVLSEGTNVTEEGAKEGCEVERVGSSVVSVGDKEGELDGVLLGE